ncbi:MAG TPA: hypothetical protein VEB22_11350 [Phycisphaerales bacterium]|nr:hypothetical protein [Phycisphaerales bacterium]
MVDPTSSSPLAPTPADAGDRVPELLEELLPLLACNYCPDPISRFEMVAIWPIGRIVAHVGCFIRNHRSASGEIVS